MKYTCGIHLRNIRALLIVPRGIEICDVAALPVLPPLLIVPRGIEINLPQSWKRMAIYLLIVPRGIEILQILQRGMNIYRLLIVPRGIEIGWGKNSRQLRPLLLIVPRGIEICLVFGLLGFFLSFNRTKRYWNIKKQRHPDILECF